jgi:hypothetical protein
MNNSRSTEIIRASEIGLYVFCARAWRLKMEGYESQNKAAMEVGSEAHQRHGARVVASVRARQLSIVLFIAAAVMLVLWLWLLVK